MAMEKLDAAALLKADHRDVEQSLVPSAWDVSSLKPMAAQGISLILVDEALETLFGQSARGRRERWPERLPSGNLKPKELPGGTPARNPVRRRRPRPRMRYCENRPRRARKGSASLGRSQRDEGR